jgi:XRE family transcriptional regulator, regulator of sulfur utilization
MSRLILSRLLVSTCAIALWATSASAQAPLRSTVFPADSARMRTGPTNQRSLVDTLTAILSKLEMHETTLAPGQSPHPPHRHAHEELMVVRRGVVEVLQGTKTRIARAGDVIFMASNELHGLKNTGTAKTTYLVIRIDPHDLPPDAKPPTTPPAR